MRVRYNSPVVLTYALVSAVALGLDLALGTQIVPTVFVVYSDFEERVIRELAESLPDLREDLLRPLDRLLDLHAVIQRHYYHPGFRGSFSIKQVLPVVVSGLSYDGLDIREGSQAALAYLEMTDPGAPEDVRHKLREALRQYCRRDTEAMVRLYQTLKEIE